MLATQLRLAEKTATFAKRMDKMVALSPNQLLGDITAVIDLWLENFATATVSQNLTRLRQAWSEHTDWRDHLTPIAKVRISKALTLPEGAMKALKKRRLNAVVYAVENPRILNMSELQRLFDHLSSTTDYSMRSIAILMATGCRFDEIAGSTFTPANGDIYDDTFIHTNRSKDPKDRFEMIPGAAPFHPDKPITKPILFGKDIGWLEDSLEIARVDKSTKNRYQRTLLKFNPLWREFIQADQEKTKPGLHVLRKIYAAIGAKQLHDLNDPKAEAVHTKALMGHGDYKSFLTYQAVRVQMDK